jgi:uncharacterized membrane protein YgdD (TMEM256/DUF423 family)
MGYLFMAFGALLGGLSVLIGAFAVHSLRGVLSPSVLALIETGARYQMYHALALLGVGLLALWHKESSVLLTITGWCFVAGALCFSGSLYGLSTGHASWLGPVTPMGGLLLLVGWGGLAIAAFKLRALAP